jgi:hypothetical protein
MTPELRQFIDEALPHRGSVEGVAKMLPADDAALDALIGETVRENDIKAFMHVITAAMSRDRRVEAHHLARGAMLFPEEGLLCAMVLRAQGDVATHLLDAIENTHLKPVCEAKALHLIAFWCQEHRGGVMPAQLVPLARTLARRTSSDPHVLSPLMAMAELVNDAGLEALLRQKHPALTDGQWREKKEANRKFGESMISLYRGSVLGWLHDNPTNELASGTTMRRAVTKTGRNEPCPCGSGRKYKHCCFEKDQQRLHHSSEVAGLTQEELAAAQAPHLTTARLDRTQPYELVRLDPVKIPPELLDTYFARLCAFNLFDCAAAALEKIGCTPERIGIWKNIMFMAARAGHKDSLRRLAKIYPDPVKLQDEIHTGAALLLAEDNPAELIRLLDECAPNAIQRNTPEELEGVSVALMYSRFRALGILVARGAVALLPKEKAAFVFEEILNTRDKLNLSPDDPVADLLDRRFAELEDDHKKESAELRKARQKLDAKAQEVRELKDSLERFQQEIARREQKRAKQTPAAPAVKSAPVDEQALKELRRKVDELKSALKERHNERNDLRRELQKAHTDLETLRQSAAPAAPDEAEPDREEELLLPPDATEGHPVRLIEFPKGFQQTLAGIPRHIARAAVIMSGRLAAGEPAAYVGALRLKALPDVMRQRIGSDHRLLFRLHPGHLQVLDLINRKDLERKIKKLV